LDELKSVQYPWPNQLCTGEEVEPGKQGL
jgi:hypothetical protein